MKHAIALFALLAAAACAQPTPPEIAAVDAPIQTDVAPFIARAARHADAEMEALAGGRLTIVDGCVRLTSPVGNPGFLVVWPRETTVDASTGAVRISNPATGSVVSVGDDVQLGGGATEGLQQPADLLEPLPPRCTGPFWIAGGHWAAKN